MRFQDKLKKNTREEIWQEYCGFLDLTPETFMEIQERLLEEQLDLFRNCSLGQELLKGKTPMNSAELRRMMPYTTYKDYADILLAEDGSALPRDPVIWLSTTWEGGIHPEKRAPYTRTMLDTYKHNVISVLMLSSSREKGHFDLRPGDRFLYGGAPLPYVTGLLPLVIGEDIDLRWLPDTTSSAGGHFSERVAQGLKMALTGGVDFFFAIGSVVDAITGQMNRSLAAGNISSGHMHVTPAIALRYVKARYECRRDGRQILPKDLFHPKGMVCTGTDSACFRANIRESWGVEPIELAAGTESTCLAVEGPEGPGMVFFPDSCFYEFIPKSEMMKSLEDPSYQPRSLLMNEVTQGQDYELVISTLHGGAFMRYRIGDMYRCIRSGKDRLPKFHFLDRVPDVIDICGFTRLTEASVQEVIDLSKQGVKDWTARKEYDEQGYPFLHMYIELTAEAQEKDVTHAGLLTELLSAHFSCYDGDYSDLKKLLGRDPLKVTILKSGAMSEYMHRTGRHIRRISPEDIDLNELLNSGSIGDGEYRGGEA